MKKVITAVVSLCAVFSSFSLHPIIAEEENTVRILFTEDLNNQLETSRSVGEDGEVHWYGSFAYMKSAIDQNRTEKTIILDAGDFSTGSVYNHLFETEAPALSLMSEMGYDAVALGDAEFLYGPGNLAKMLSVPEEKPVLLASNMNVIGSDLTSTWKACGNTCTVIERDGVKVGVFSLLGEAYSELSPGNIEILPAADTAKEMVEELKNKGADVIVCLSHCNTDTDQNADRKIAETVDGIHVIISGHTPAEASMALKVKNTVIVNGSMNGKYLGVLDVNAANGEVTNYQLREVTYENGADEDVKNKVAEYAKKLNTDVFAGTGYTTASPLSRSSFTFDEHSEFTFSNTADMILDSYIELYKEQLAMKKLEAARKAEEEAARRAEKEAEEAEQAEEAENDDAEDVEGEEIEPEEEEEEVSTFSKQGILNLLEDAKESWLEVLNGTTEEKTPKFSEKPIAILGSKELNSTFYEGTITASDVYTVLSSSTQDGRTSPLIIAYIKGSDLRRICEYDLISKEETSDDYLYFGNLKYEYNDKRQRYNKVTKVEYRATVEYFVPVESSVYYPVVMSMDLAKKLTKAKEDLDSENSFALCNAKGKPVTSMQTLVISMNDEPVNQWMTAVKFIDSFGREGSVGQVDTAYGTAVVQKSEDTSIGLKAMFRNTSISGWRSYGEFGFKVLGVLVVLKLINSILRRTSLKKGNE